MTRSFIIKSVLHVAASPATSGKISASSSGVFALGRASGMSGRGGSELGGLIGGAGTGRGGCGRLNLGVSNGKSGNPRIRRWKKKHTQGSKLLLDADTAFMVRGCPKQVTLDGIIAILPTLEKASMLHIQEDMVMVGVR